MGFPIYANVVVGRQLPPPAFVLQTGHAPVADFNLVAFEIGASVQVTLPTLRLFKLSVRRLRVTPIPPVLLPL
jgi:hypothetical protein